MSWQSTLAELLSKRRFTSQGSIVNALKTEGFVLNQATVSRELKRLGARKVSGIYQLTNQKNFGAPVFSIDTTSNGCLIILKTRPAFASVLAHHIDLSSIDGVLGTIAGDDTVFIAVREGTSLTTIKEYIGLSVL
jgi:transcriptional regulator of arginine metabolism